MTLSTSEVAVCCSSASFALAPKPRDLYLLGDGGGYDGDARPLAHSGALPLSLSGVAFYAALPPALSGRLIASPEAQAAGIVAAQTSTAKRGSANVRFGSKADMCSAKGHVCFSPEADMCRALANVRFVPIAYIWASEDHAFNSERKAAARGKIILISVNSPDKVSTSIDPPCCLTMMS